jgi:large subunit ribosomal protein L5
MARLKNRYLEEIRPGLAKDAGYKNVNEVPRLSKIVINAGVGDAIGEPKKLDHAVAELAAITGQRPVIRRARKSISNFKLRAGMAVGCSVTLRGDRMYEFLDRLVNVAIPRIRDFRGLPSKSFDGRGNYTLGITEQIIFPEIDYDKIEKIRGMNITIATTAQTDSEAFELLKAFGMPFRRN